MTHRATKTLLWALLIAVLCGPVVLATTSPYLSYRDPVYIFAGFAGIIAMALLVVQALLSRPPSRLIARPAARRWHRITGTLITALVLTHVGGLYLVSPPDTLDALMLRAPTLFSFFGVAALWACLLAAGLALARRTLPLRPLIWKRAHQSLASGLVIATVIHAIKIEGAMEPVSKALLGALLIGLTVWLALRQRVART